MEIEIEMTQDAASEREMANALGLLAGYTLERDGEPQEGLCRYRLTLQEPVSPLSTVKVVYCQSGGAAAGTGQIVSEASGMWTFLNGQDDEDAEAVRQRLLPFCAEARTPMPFMAGAWPCPTGPLGQWDDPEGGDYNQPFATLELTDLETYDAASVRAMAMLADFIACLQEAEGSAEEVLGMTRRMAELLAAAAADDGSALSDIIDELAALAAVAEGILQGCQHDGLALLARPHDLLLPLLYEGEQVSTLLRLPAAFGRADGEFVTLLDQLASGWQALTGAGMTAEDRRRQVEDDLLPRCGHLADLASGLLAGIGALLSAADRLRALSQSLSRSLSTAHGSSNPDAWERQVRREIMEETAADIVNRQQQLWTHAAAPDATAADRASVATENNLLAELHHLIDDWHYQFYSVPPEEMGAHFGMLQ